MGARLFPDPLDHLLITLSRRGFRKALRGEPQKIEQAAVQRARINIFSQFSRAAGLCFVDHPGQVDKAAELLTRAAGVRSGQIHDETPICMWGRRGKKTVAAGDSHSVRHAPHP